MARLSLSPILRKFVPVFCSALLSLGTPGLAQTSETRVMPLGDSLTVGYSVPNYLSGYRDLLYALLTDDGIDVNYVGTMTDTQNSSIPDPDHEGHGGYRIDQIDSGITGWLNSVASPDVVLLLVGTNDFWQNYNTSTASARLESLVNKIATQRPNARVLVSTLPPRTDSASTEAAQVSFNATIPGIVNRQLAAGHRVYFVDMHRVLVAADLSSDGVHLNEAGYDKMANAWAPAVEHALGADANVLANASFESGSTSWTSSGNLNFATVGSSYQPRDGSRLVIFNDAQRAPNGTLSQTFATTAGRTYVLQFDYGVIAYNTNQQQLRVQVEGSSTLLSQTVSITGVKNGTVKWATGIYVFTANSSSTTLRFTDVSTNTNSIDLLLDSVQVRPRAPRTLTVGTSPANGVSIVVSPSDTGGQNNGVSSFTRTYLEGTAVTLTAPATANGNAFVKWQVDGADFATTPTVYVPMRGSHTATAVYGISPPAITQPPRSVTATVGGSVTLSVTASGSSLSYQWRLNGNPISGATGSSYTIPSVQTSHAGQYTVSVTNSSNTVTSSPATLTVVTSGTIANASFETDYSGWTQTGNQTITSTAPYTASQGSKLVVFNGGSTSPNGRLSQSFVTTPGRVYTLAFDAGVYAFNTNEQRLRVTVQGASTLLSQTISLFGTGGGNLRWAAQRFNFTADDDFTTLTFEDVSPTTANLDLLLDNVRLSPMTSRTLSVTSTPGAGVSVTVSPADTGGATSGTTNFTRTYTQNTSVTLTAPANSGANVFQRWQRDGADYSTNRSVTFAMDDDYTLTAVYAAVGSFSNGSFESGSTGWTTSGNQQIVSNGSYPATQGTAVVVFNGGQSTPNGSFSQTFATTAGQSYTVQFDLGTYAFNTSEQRLRVTVQGGAPLLNQTLSVFGGGNGTTRWVAGNYTFVADGSTATLTFQDVSPTTTNLDMLLDNVRVTAATQRTLTVQSAPMTGVSIGVSPADVNGATTGSTTFTRRYAHGAAVTLTAPSVSGSSAFQKWQRNGADFSNSTSIAVTLDADHTLVAVYAAAAAFTNGSFESNYAGWSPNGNQTIVSSGYPASQGTHVVVFNGGQTTPTGVLSQTFATTSGQSYTVRFDMGVLGYNKNAQRLQVTARGAGTLLSQTVSLNGTGNGTVAWTSPSFTFTADSGVTTLTFTDVSTTSNSIDLLLDNVRVTP